MNLPQAIAPQKLSRLATSLLDGAFFVVGYWDTKPGTSMTAVAAPTNGVMQGTDGRTYDRIKRHEPFTVATHPDLVNEAAYGIRRTLSRPQRAFCDQLQNAFDLSLPEAVAVVQALPPELASALYAIPTPPAMSQAEADSLLPTMLRNRIADAMLEGYDFGGDVRFEGSDGWNHTSGGVDWTCKVYVATDETGTDEPSIPLTFTVTFHEGTAAPAECGALDRHGDYWGSHPHFEREATEGMRP